MQNLNIMLNAQQLVSINVTPAKAQFMLQHCVYTCTYKRTLHLLRKAMLRTAHTAQAKQAKICAQQLFNMFA
jgi:hypothetical protein